MMQRYYSYIIIGGSCDSQGKILYDGEDYIDTDWNLFIINGRKYNENNFKTEIDSELYNYGGCRGSQYIRIVRHNYMVNNKKLSVIEHDSGYDPITLNRIEYDNKIYKNK